MLPLAQLPALLEDVVRVREAARQRG